MKKDFIYLLVIGLLICATLQARIDQSKYFYFEEQVHHGLHYGVWSDYGNGGHYFLKVRCFEVDSAEAKHK